MKISHLVKKKKDNQKKLLESYLKYRNEHIKIRSTDRKLKSKSTAFIQESTFKFIHKNVLSDNFKQLINLLLIVKYRKFLRLFFSIPMKLWTIQPISVYNELIRQGKIFMHIDFVDENGDSWEEYIVFHPKFLKWLKVNNYNLDEVKSEADNVINDDIESPDECVTLWLVKSLW